MLDAGAAEQVAAVAERVGGEPPQVLAVVGQQREVVGDEVGGGDRDQRVHEAPRRARARESRRPSRGIPLTPARPDRASRRRSRSAGRRRTRARARSPCESPSAGEAVLEVGDDAVEQRALAWRRRTRSCRSRPAARAVVPAHGRQRRRADAPAGAARAARPPAGRAARAARTARTRRRTRRRGASTPRRRRGSCRRAGSPGRRASARASGAGSRAAAQHSSQIAKASDAGRGRPVAEPLGIGQRLGHRVAADAAPRPSPSAGRSPATGSAGGRRRRAAARANGMPTQKPT